MLAIILAAGNGNPTRFLSSSHPAQLLPVADRPVIAHTADAAIEAGADELVFVVNGHTDLHRWFGDEYGGVPVTYEIQTEPTGTAEAVRMAHYLIDGPFAVLNGDNLYDAESLRRLFAAGPAVGTHSVMNPSQYGVITIEEDTVTCVVEKPHSPTTNRANTGAYIFPTKARDWLTVPRSDRGKHELTDVLRRVISAFDVTPIDVDRWMDVTYPWRYLEANEWKLSALTQQLDGDVHPSAHVRGRVVVEPEATIDAGAVVEGPTLVRNGASVGPNAYVRGATLVDEGVSLGSGVEVSNSVFMTGAHAAHRCFVGDSILGPAVSLGAGTTVANTRHDGDVVHITRNGRDISTARTSFGAVIGEGTRTGVNTTTDAGVSLSPNSRTMPGEVVLRSR